MGKKVKRLFEQFVPEHYQLQLQPDRETMTFTGRVVIAGSKKGRPSQRLTLHQKDLRIHSATVEHHDKKGSKPISVDRINNHKAYDEVRLHTKQPLYGGKYSITLEFSGNITQPMNGIYPCFYEHKGQKKKLIATQFESHHAREAFVCIDEPEAKATFDLILTTPKDEPVIANTPIKTQKVVGESVVTTFETTPIMSSYLLAFVFGDMQFKEAKTKQGTLVRAYATPDKARFTGFALDTAVKCLDFYNDYFGIPYPLQKCDMIALPDFASGAMENWGCITYREQCMLVDPANTSLSTRQYVAMVVCHELAHQWFGNLVTMRWWTDLWLNEGFASWIEYLAVDHIFPEWEMWTQFIADEQQVAFRLDALKNTHPIEVTVHHPDEIRTIFDTISYAKGSSVIHMLEHYLGRETFRDGLRLYLQKHQYGNTDTVDLWDALEEASKKPVKKFMHAWTGLSGFPIVKAVVGKDTLQLAQSRFIVTNPSANSTEKWPVPLLSNIDELKDAVLDQQEGSFSVKETAGLLLNAERSGFYRTVYDSAHVEQLTKQVSTAKLSVLDRLGLLGDSFEAAKAGQAKTIDALKLLAAYADESNSAVWDVIAANIADVRAVMDDETLRDAMKPYTRKLVAKQLKRLGWDKKPGESHLDSLLRPTILGMASQADEPAVCQAALKMFGELKTPDDIEPDLRGVIYGTAARNGGKKEFDKLLKIHNASDSSEERTTIAAALTGFKQPELIGRALSYIDTDTVRLQDVSYWVAYSFMNRFARKDAWDWMVTHWGWLRKNLGSDLSFYRFPVYAGRAFSDQQFLKEYEAFFKKVMSPGLERSVKQGVEMVQWHAAWKKRDFKDIQAFFNQK